MAGAVKQFFADIQLKSSIVKDDSGNQISITSEERLSIVNANGGPATSINPLTTKSYVDTSINTAVSNVQVGLKWRDPVNFLATRYAVSATAPVAPVEGDKYVKTTDAKLYTYTSSAWNAGVQIANGLKVVDITTGKYFTVVAGALDAGVVPTSGFRYIDLVSGKIYTFTTVWDAGLTPTADVTVVAQDTDGTWTYDLDTTTWIRTDVNSLPIASTAQYGKVMLAAHGETTSGEAVQGSDPRLGKGFYSATLTGTGTMVLTHNLNTTKVIIQVWKSDELIEVGIARNVADANNKLDISVHGPSGDVEVYVIGF